jgi:hypothetical protein
MMLEVLFSLNNFLQLPRPPMGLPWTHVFRSRGQGHSGSLGPVGGCVSL